MAAGQARPSRPGECPAAIMAQLLSVRVAVQSPEWALPLALRPGPSPPAAVEISTQRIRAQR